MLLVTWVNLVKEMGIMEADYVLTGKIFTAAQKHKYVEAVAVKDGKFVYVGSKDGAKSYIGPKTEYIVNNNGLFIPGMTDSHMHFSSGATEGMYKIQLAGGKSVDDYTKIIKKYVDEHPDRDYYMGTGWENAIIAERPDKSWIDAACSDKPVLLQSVDGHSYIVNSKALENAGIGKGYVSKEKGEFVLDPKTKEPTGLVREWAMGDILKTVPDYTVEEIKKAVLWLQDRLLSMGLTSVYEPILRDETRAQQALEELDIEGKLKLKVVSGFHIRPEHDSPDKLDDFAAIRDAYHGKHYKCNNLKFVVDGVVESATAYFFDDYVHKPGYRGNFNCTQEQLNNMMRRAKEKGFQVHCHVIGDAAIDAALTGIEYAQAKKPKKDWRPTLTHLQVIRESDIARMAKDKVIAACDPAWFFKDPIYFDALEVKYLGLERASREYKLKSFWDQGVLVSAATDFPVTNPDPMETIEVGVTRCAPGDKSEKTVLDPTERVSVEQMLTSYTINGAFQNFREKETGSIEVGKAADMVLLDQDLFTINPHDIHNTKPIFTMIDGKMVYSRGKK